MIKRPLLLLFSALFLSHPALAREGVTVRGGGDDTALEFTSAFHAALHEIEQNQPEIGSKITSFAPAERLARASIFVEDRPVILPLESGAQETVAASDPALNRILINRARWRGVGHSRIREAIALHTVLHLAGLEEANEHPLSGAYLKHFGVSSDITVFLNGRDPSLPEWQRRLITCGDSSVAEATWWVLNKSYSLRYRLPKAPSPAPQAECREEALDPAEWIALLREPGLAIEVEKLNSRAALLGEAIRALRDCRGAACQGEMAAYAAEKKKFEAAFERTWRAGKGKLQK